MKRYYLFVLAFWLFRRLRNTILHRLKLAGFTVALADLEMDLQRAFKQGSANPLDKDRKGQTKCSKP